MLSLRHFELFVDMGKSLRKWLMTEGGFCKLILDAKVVKFDPTQNLLELDGGF